MVWRKLIAVMALPVGAALYTAYHGYSSAEATCRQLRGSILATLEQPGDRRVKEVLVHKDMAAFERGCALTDADARAVYAAFDRVLFAIDPESVRRARFVPPFQEWLRREPPALRPRQRLLDPRERSFGT